MVTWCFLFQPPFQLERFVLKSQEEMAKKSAFLKSLQRLKISEHKLIEKTAKRKLHNTAVELLSVALRLQ